MNHPLGTGCAAYAGLYTEILQMDVRMKKLFLLMVGLLLLGTMNARAQANIRWANGTSNVTNDFYVPYNAGANNWPTVAAPQNFTVNFTVSGSNLTLSWQTNGNGSIPGQARMMPGTPQIEVKNAAGQVIQSGAQVTAGNYNVTCWNTLANIGNQQVRAIVEPNTFPPIWDTYQITFTISQGQGAQPVNATAGWRTTRQRQSQQQQQQGQQQQQQGTQQQQQGTVFNFRGMYALLQRWNQTVNRQVLNSRLGQFNPNSRSYPGGYVPRLLLRAGYPLNASLSTTTTPAGKTAVKVTFPGRKTPTRQSSISNGRVYQTRSVLSRGGGRAKR